MLRNLIFGANLALVHCQKSLFFQPTKKSDFKNSVSNVSHFDFKSRVKHLEELKTNPDFDVLIIGGGVSGAGVLLECSRKGLKTILIEANDFSSGASSKSTKLLHGGLRYLENAFKLGNRNRKEDFTLIQESIIERNLLMNSAPYISKNIGIVIPVTNIFSCLFYYLGSWFYEHFEKIYSYAQFKAPILSKGLPISFPNSKILFSEDLHKIFPNLSTKHKYGVLLWDGQIDDSKLVIDLILTATSVIDPAIRQNNALNYVKLTAFEKAPNGNIIGAHLFDKLSNESFFIKTKIVVNATGTSADLIRKLANPELKNRILGSKGDHLTIDNSDNEIINSRSENIGLLIPKTKDGRLMFVLPWKNVVITGTTDKFVENPTVHATSDKESANQIIDNVREYIPMTDIRILSKWSGFRPLVFDQNTTPESAINIDSIENLNQISKMVESKDIKRSHVIEIDPKSGLVSVMGGKLTIFRLMAEDCIHAVLTELKRKEEINEPMYNQYLAKSTRNLRLIGDFRPKIFDLDSLDNQFSIQSRQDFLDILKFHFKLEFNNIEDEIVNHLVETYGHRSILIAKRFKNDKTELLKIDPNYPITKGEIFHICQTEMVANATELITRRLRLSFLNRSDAEKLLPIFTDLYGDYYGWDDQRKKQEYEFNIALFKLMDF